MFILLRSDEDQPANVCANLYRVDMTGGLMTVQTLVTSDADHAPWEGSLTFSIECRHARNATSGELHEIAIHDDWTVVTPHDMNAERVALAFGGYTSCVDLVDRTIPLLRDGLHRVARSTRPQLRRDKRDQWRAPLQEMASCCRNRAFASVRTIVDHLCSPIHLSNLWAVPLWQAETVVHEVARVCRADLGATAPEARFVREAGGLVQLWHSGIHPRDIPTLACFASAAAEALPAAYFEGVVYSGHHPEWINDVLAYRPDADTAAWLAWQAPPDESLGAATDWGRWLGYGVSRRDFALALERGVSADSIRAVAESTGWTVRTAARVVLDYAKAECHPTPLQLSAVARGGMEYLIPAAGAVDWAMDAVQRLGASIDRTELGVMLTLTGSRPALLSTVQRGARRITDLPNFAL